MATPGILVLASLRDKGAGTMTNDEKRMMQWLHNDSAMFERMLKTRECADSVESATLALYYSLVEGLYGRYNKITPWGSPWSVTAIRAAMDGLQA